MVCEQLCKFNSCCCQHHVQMLELKDAYNSMKPGLVHGTTCICGCRVCKPDGVHYVCASTLSTVTRVKVMCELILYPKFDTDEYHKLLCIRRDCNNCGISKLQLCPSAVDPNNEIFIAWK
jgi:hypothetical protein